MIRRHQTGVRVSRARRFANLQFKADPQARISIVIENHRRIDCGLGQVIKQAHLIHGDRLTAAS